MPPGRHPQFVRALGETAGLGVVILLTRSCAVHQIAEWAWGLTGGRGVVTTTKATADSADTGSIPTTASYFGVTDSDLGDALNRTPVDRWVWHARYVKLLLIV